jgi:hypothetical protein
MGGNLNSNWLPYAQYELELGLAAMGAIWIWTWVGYHAHKTLITQMSISKWKFHNDKQMLFDVLINSLISKEKKIAISYIQVALLLNSSYLFG